MLWVDGVVLGSVLSFGGIPISGYSMESSPTPTLYNTFRCTLLLRPASCSQLWPALSHPLIGRYHCYYCCVYYEFSLPNTQIPLPLQRLLVCYAQMLANVDRPFLERKPPMRLAFSDIVININININIRMLFQY